MVIPLTPNLIFKAKVNPTPNTSWRLREGMERWASNFALTFGANRTAQMSILRAGRTLRPTKLLGTLLFEAEWLLNADRMIRSLEISKDPAGNRSRDFPHCGAVLQPTVPPLASQTYIKICPNVLVHPTTVLNAVIFFIIRHFFSVNLSLQRCLSGQLRMAFSSLRHNAIVPVLTPHFNPHNLQIPFLN